MQYNYDIIITIGVVQMKETFKNLKIVFKYGKEYNKHLIIFTVVTLLGIGFNILAPFFMAKQIVQLTNNQFNQLIFTTLVILGIETLNSLKSVIISHNTARYFRGVAKNIQNELGREMLKVELSDIDKTPSGAFIQRLTTDTNHISQFITRGEGFLTSILSKIGIFITVFIINLQI